MIFWYLEFWMIRYQILVICNIHDVSCSPNYMKYKKHWSLLLLEKAVKIGCLAHVLPMNYLQFRTLRGRGCIPLLLNFIKFNTAYYPSNRYHIIAWNFRGVNILQFCLILLKNKFSRIKFLWSSFQTRITSVMNLKFTEEKVCGHSLTREIHKNFQSQKFWLYGTCNNVHVHTLYTQVVKPSQEQVFTLLHTTFVILPLYNW